MRILEVIESKCWLNIKTNQTVSIYGAVPWTNDNGKSDWVLHTRGYTWRLSNGTVGLGRQPCKTLEEAQEVMRTFNQRRE